jgi:hypothetical protein
MRLRCAPRTAFLVLFLAGCNATIPSAASGLAARSAHAAAHPPSNRTFVILNQHHKVYANLNVATSSGDCVQITDSSDIVLEASQIGPCGGNGVNVSGGGKIQIVDDYIHPEILSQGCCDTNDGVLVQNATGVLIQGNVIAYGESNVEAPQGATSLDVAGNFLLNPRGPFPRGQNVQAWNGSAVLVRNNYTLASTDTSLYLYPDDQEDSINVGMGSGFSAEDNYVTGGHSVSGCGLLADDGADNVRFAGNRIVDSGQCGIGIASGTNQQVAHNRIINQTPVPGGGNTALYVWNQYAGVACGPVSVSANIATEVRADGTQSGFWNGGGCDPVTLTHDIWDEAADKRLTPVATKLPPPAIPPQPKHCAIESPYSNQIKWPAC